MNLLTSNHVIFTSDNPRNENPKRILRDIVSGIPKKMKNYECLIDRATAIDKACKIAHPGDIVLVAGKGHETYQIFKTKKIHFSDFEELKHCFQRIAQIS